MCLDSTKVKADRKIITDALEVNKNGYITLYKVFTVNKHQELMPQFKKFKFFQGKNTADGDTITGLEGQKSDLQYKPGFHSFTTKSSAEFWGKYSNRSYFNHKEVVVYPVKVKKEWIINVGVQDDMIVVVSKHIFI